MTEPLIEKEFLIQKVSGDVKIRLVVEKEDNTVGSYISISTLVFVDDVQMQASENSFLIVNKKLDDDERRRLHRAYECANGNHVLNRETYNPESDFGECVYCHNRVDARG